MDALVTTKQLTKRFGAFTAVDSVTFSAQPGEIFGLLGPNGAGKTTTIRMIATILSPTSGTATIKGFDIHTHPEDVRRHIGELTTDIGVYQRLSGREHLQYFGELYGLKNDRIHQRIEELSDLLDMRAFLDKRAGQYSTGMKQKLAIARSVIHDPDLIIFDEPTAGLDVLASRTVLAFMREAKARGKCIILSTHEMTDAEKLCERVAIMHQGKIVTIDTVANVKQQTGTDDLEEAFVRLVHGDTQTTTTSPAPVQPQRQLSGTTKILILRAATILLVLAGIGGNAAHWFPLTVGYVLIVVGIVAALVSKRLQKKTATP